MKIHTCRQERWIRAVQVYAKQADALAFCLKQGLQSAAAVLYSGSSR